MIVEELLIDEPVQTHGRTEGRTEKQRMRTLRTNNMHICDISHCHNGLFPEIKGTGYVPKKLVAFSDLKNAQLSNTVHFFIDDYRFERIWNNPSEQIQKLRRFECVLSPDFSIYADMPYPVQLYNEYRKRLIQHAMEKVGIQVIPTLGWSTSETIEHLLSGIPAGGTVAVSTVGCCKDRIARERFRIGMDYAIEKIRPETVVVYGKRFDYDFTKVNAVFFRPDTNGAENGR